MRTFAHAKAQVGPEPAMATADDGTECWVGNIVVIDLDTGLPPVDDAGRPLLFKEVNCRKRIGIAYDPRFPSYDGVTDATITVRRRFQLRERPDA